MKKAFKLSFILLAFLGVMFTSCKKDYPEPPIQVLPIGTVYTIDEILNMESGTVFNEDASVYGIVTADEQSGNLYKAAFMQDRATGKAIELYMNATSGVRIGDSIRVYLKDVTYTQYNGLPQLSNFEADGHIVILANNKPIQPAEATIADVVAGNYLAGLVKLSNVMFTEKNTFAEPTTYGNRTLVDPTDFSKSVIVRTSNYANFANDSLPQGTGNLVCIASVYGSTWQLLIRSATELEFDGYTPSGGGTTLPYYQDFASSFGTYSTYDVLGSESWEIDYSTAKMTGYVGGVNKANEDWLISAPVSFEGVTEVSLTMRYIARYFSNLNEDVTIQVSTDYTSGDPNNANWTQMAASLSEGSNWNDFLTAEVDLSQFAGQKVVVAVKYVSNDTKAGTIEIQSMLIQEGGGVTPPEPPTPGGELQAMPYTQSFATDFGTYMIYDVEGPQGWVIDYSTAKMTGYASGTNYVNEDWLISSPVAVTGVQNAKASVTYVAQYQNSNANDVTLQVSTDYVWGNDPRTANWTQMSTTYPNTGGWSDFQTVETSLNDFIGQNVTVAIKFTSTDSQSRTLEVQTITVQEGEVGGVTPPGPGTVTGDGSRENPYTASDIILLGIESSDGNKYWVKDYIVGVIDGSYVYQFTSNTEVNTNIILSSNANASSDTECIPIQLPNGAVREGLNLATNPGNLGQEVLLYGTLEKYFRVPGVKNVTYAEINGNGIGTDPGVEPPTPPQGIFTETFANGQGDFVIENTLLPDELTYVWSHAANYSCMKASAYVGHAYETESWLVSPYIDLSNCTSATLTFEQAVNYASPQDALYVLITTEYVDTVDGIEWDELQLNAWPAGSDWTFITSTVDLTPYVGQRVTIAFMYTSTNSASATWEVKNFVVSE